VIIRTQKQRRFTTVDNAPFQDKRLHWDTRGLLGYLLTKPDGWEIRIEDLLKQEEPEDGSRATGREKIFRMLRELKTYGYLYRDQVNGVDGRFETICYIYENPHDNPYWAAAQEDEQQEDGLGEDEAVAEQLELTAVGKDDHGQTVVGKAVHGGTVHGKAVDGNAGNGKAVNGKADHIVKTDQRSNTDQVIPGRKQKLNDDPPHIRQMAALNGVGLTAAQRELTNKLRLAFGFRDAEAAADATRSLLNVGIEKWDQEMQDLLDALKGVSKGVVPNTLFRDFFALLDEEATVEEINTLFGNDKATSWWIAASGMRGLPWPSQVANNLAVARLWQENRANGRPDARQGPAKKVSQATSSLMAFAQRAQGGDQ
jgi:hypothetical protein